jgi:hypothetical protein
MTNPPPLPPDDPRTPPILGYSAIRPSFRNSPGKFLLRAAIGIFIGIFGCVAGYFLAAYTNVPLLFFLPISLALVAAIIYAVTQRKYGFVTGIIIAPFFLAIGVAALLLIMCGSLLVGK